MADHDIYPKNIAHAVSSAKMDFLQVQWIAPQGVLYVDNWMRSQDATHCQCIGGYPVSDGEHWILSELPAPARIDVKFQHKPTPTEAGDYVLMASVKKVGYGHESVTVSIYQYVPIGDTETEVASFDVLASNEFAQQALALNVAQIALITDWGRLRMRVTNPHRHSRGIYVTQACLCIPNGYIYEFFACPEPCAHAVTTTNALLGHHHIVTPDDCAHAFQGDGVEVVQNPVTPDACAHTHTAQAPSIVNVHHVSPEDTAHKFNIHQHIYIAASEHVLRSTQCIAYYNYEVVPRDVTEAHTAQSPGISEA